MEHNKPTHLVALDHSPSNNPCYDSTRVAVTSPSPFLPSTNIQFAWDSTSLGYFKTCPRLYYYQMIEGYVPRGDNIHLRFGVELHDAFQQFDILAASGVDYPDCLRKTVRRLLERIHDWDPDPTSKAGAFKNRKSLLRTVINFLDEHRYDQSVATHILPSGKAAVELSFRFELPFGPTPDQPYLLCGHLDRVVEFGDGLFVMDYKTTTSTPGAYYFDQYEPHNQMTLYSLGAQIVLASPIRGVIINAIQILANSNRFQRGFTYRTEDQLAEWQADLQFHLLLAKAYAENEHWPMNDTACDKFGGCRFRSVCKASPSTRPIYLRDFHKAEREDRWNPLRSR